MPVMTGDGTSLFTGYLSATLLIRAVLGAKPMYSRFFI